MPVTDQNLNTLIEKSIDAIAREQYGALVRLLETICKATEDEEVFERLQEIRRDMPISLAKFETYYFMSRAVDGRRSIVFRDIGRVRFEEIPSLYNTYVIQPVTELAVRKIGELSRDKGTTINRYIKGKAGVAESFERKAPEVILDA